MDIMLKYFDDFTPKQLNQFAALKGLYKEWNEKINVISRKDIDAIYLHHVLHSLSIAAIANFKAGTDIIDIGCGGGFPSIPLAIFFPEVKFHLVDSVGKKLKVVEAVAQAIELKNVTIQHTRVEAIKNKKFDFAISRAVAPLKELWLWSNPLLKKNTQHTTQEIANGLICLKGGNLHQEISESNTKPAMMSVYNIFKEDFFKEKYILYVRK
ncbi:MAG: 16S rRNA (guanine(527)-N(7))-methyltransferase RsmG [Chitinophagaceae bacterium]|nr:16S rRNA (guanine(527)-N(7))-methyltransferase RsmG [Chitinophagaceae bacterium]MCW5905876.1 16S rRNA (guanine(527)-N(7))-methyltransferase RsmG [Chitinophagaceae bacterium]